jgi:ubiquinone/menaquinone biosynthesis C-methylase UbiE
MEPMRKPFQGVSNIVRFNWHYYVFSVMAVVCLLLANNRLSSAPHVTIIFFVWLIIIATLISLSVSFFIYDISPLYKLSWLNSLTVGREIVNINAGFDETSSLLKEKFRNTDLKVLDFYDPIKHTEVSIKRARKAYPPFPDTQHTSTTRLPLQNNSADDIFAILSAHEIRKDEERVFFFRELNRILRINGQVIVTEHLRDTANFLAYNIGFFHFHSKATWLKTFRSAGFSVAKEIKITPFITTFILSKNGTAS